MIAELNKAHQYANVSRGVVAWLDPGDDPGIKPGGDGRGIGQAARTTLKQIKV